MLLLYAGLLINRAQAVRVRGQSTGPWSTLGRLSDFLGRWKNGVSRRGDFFARNLLMDSLQNDQDLFHSPLHTARRNINLLERLAVGRSRDLPHRKALWKDAIVA